MVVIFLLSTEMVFIVDGNAPESFRETLKSELIVQSANPSPWNFSKIKEEIQIQLKGLAESNTTRAFEVPDEVEVFIKRFEVRTIAVRDKKFEKKYFNKVVKAVKELKVSLEVSFRGKKFEIEDNMRSPTFYISREKIKGGIAEYDSGSPQIENELAEKLARKILLQISPPSGD